MFKWIHDAYFEFLWWIGMPDKDGNHATWTDRFPITYMARNQKARMGMYWYLLVLPTLYTSVYLLYRERFSLGWIWAIPLFLFLNWLFIHVDLTTDTGDWNR